MYTHVVFLGRETDLAFAELAVTLKAIGLAEPKRIPHVSAALVQISDDQALQLQNDLGGITKIARIITELASTSNEEEILHAIQSFVDRFASTQIKRKSKITFSISVLSKNNEVGIAGLTIKKVNEVVKDYLENIGYSSRFVLGSATGLSSVQFTTQNIAKKGFELVILAMPETVVLGQTITVQDYRTWQHRDYGRPFSDPKRGMLPPKLARMMVNIAKSLYSASGKAPSTLLDPFCGEGTILQEALFLGLSVYGSDIDERAVADTKGNLEWFVKSNQSGTQGIGEIKKIVRISIVGLTNKVIEEPVDLIVTEPDLGPPIRGKLHKEVAETIKKTYGRLFLQLPERSSQLQQSGSILGVVVPKVQDRQFSQVLLAKDVLDTREKFGYTLVEGPYSYARPDAKIGRSIYFFRKR